MGIFRKPDFRKKSLEFRFENGIVCIYGTKEGLKKIADYCNSLIKHPGQGHIHLEKCGVLGILTDESERGAIAIFEECF